MRPLLMTVCAGDYESGVSQKFKKNEFITYFVLYYKLINFWLTPLSNLFQELKISNCIHV